MLKKSLILICCVTPSLTYSMSLSYSLGGSGKQASSSSSSTLTPVRIQTGIDPQSICHPLTPEQYTAIMLARAQIAKSLYPYQTCRWFTNPNEQADRTILSLIDRIPHSSNPQYAEWKNQIQKAVSAGGNTNTNLIAGLPAAIALEEYANRTNVWYNPTPPVNKSLSEAIKNGDFEFAQIHLQNGAFANAAGASEEDGPFAVAKTLTMVRLLVQFNGQPKYFFYGFSKTPLHKAVKNGYEAALIPYYTQLGVDPNQRGGQTKSTPLHDLIDLTRDSNYPSEKILEKAQLLLQAGANNTVTNQYGETPSQFAERTMKLVSPEAAQRCEQLKTLIESHG